MQVSDMKQVPDTLTDCSTANRQVIVAGSSSDSGSCGCTGRSSGGRSSSYPLHSVPAACSKQSLAQP